MKYKAKDDCFAYDKEKHNCKALNTVCCKTGKCNFYKNKQQYMKENKKYS